MNDPGPARPVSGIHVVLGGTGVVGREASAALSARGLPVVTVSRTAPPARPDADKVATRWLRADLCRAADVHAALDGASVAYLTAGLPYSTRVWRRTWPLIVRNAAEACLERGVHLVYFDNVYAYGPTAGAMTERTAIAPSTGKGRVRADAIAIIEAARTRGLLCTIARSADFYGPGATTSAFNRFAIDAVAAGRPPAWLFDLDQPHSMTYTPDIGSALAVLGTDPLATGRTWHLPTATALTGRGYLALTGAPDQRTLTSVAMRLGSVFSRDARETLEMAYQYTQPYEFSSREFEDAFDVAPTAYETGIAASLDHSRVPA